MLEADAGVVPGLTLMEDLTAVTLCAAAPPPINDEAAAMTSRLELFPLRFMGPLGIAAGEVGGSHGRRRARHRMRARRAFLAGTRSARRRRGQGGGHGASAPRPRRQRTALRFSRVADRRRLPKSLLRDRAVRMNTGPRAEPERSLPRGWRAGWRNLGTGGGGGKARNL